MSEIDHIESDHDDKLQRIIEIERELGEIQDVDVLLERILTFDRPVGRFVV